MKRLALALLVAGCGNDRAPLADARPDPPPDIALPAGCDWLELADPTNDITISNGLPEATGLELAQAFTLCGRIDNNHFDAEKQSVDIDSYDVELEARTQVLVSLAAPGGEALTSVRLEVLDRTNAVVAAGTLLGAQAVFATTLAAGRYRLAVRATNASDLAAPLDYRLRLAADAPDTRCAPPTTAAAYTEANDGAQNNRNDVVEVRYTPAERALTAAANDAPEDTAITTATASVRIAGTSADVDAPDEFKDRDSYLVTTGAHDRLTIRVDWTGDADFDFLVFPEGTVAEIASGTAVAKLAPELATFPVLANTRYWLWIASYDTTTGLPITYSATLCPETAP